VIVMLSGKLGEFSPSHVDIYSSISQVNFTAVFTSSQIGEIMGVRWRAISPIFFTNLPTYGPGLRPILTVRNRNLKKTFLTKLTKSYVYSAFLTVRNTSHF